MVANPSLSVVLPVHNAEQNLADQLAQLLEILPDLTHNFEVLVINDGSTDHTEEIAYELARIYPQVRVTRHERRRGSQAVIETGLAQTSGDILIIQDEHAPIDSSKLHRLWALRNDEDLVPPRPDFRIKETMKRFVGWGIRLEEATEQGGSAGVQMIRRDSLPRLNEWVAKESNGPSRRSRTDQPGGARSPQTNSKAIHRDRPRPILRQL